MLNPTVSCTIERLSKTDLYGKEKLADPVALMCAVVRLSNASEKTSVRADSSASRGTASEITRDCRLLFLPSTSMKFGDKLNIAGMELKVAEIQTRFDMRGKPDHLQVDLNAWA